MCPACGSVKKEWPRKMNRRPVQIIKILEIQEFVPSYTHIGTPLVHSSAWHASPFFFSDGNILSGTDARAKEHMLTAGG